MSEQLTPVENKAVTPVPQGAWGSEDTSSKDLVVPRLALCQAMSQPAKDGKARPGEILHSQSGAVMVPRGGEIELLPILTVGTWVISQPQVGQQPKFLRMEPVTRENDSDNWKIEKHENGAPVLYQKRLSVLVLPVDALDGFPFFVDFQKTNRRPGQVLSTIIQENKFRNLPACARVIKLSTQLKTKDSNSWFVYTVSPDRAATAEEMAACYKWYDLFGAKAKEAAMADSGEDKGGDEQVPF